MKKPMNENDWQAHSDLRTLIEAHKIKSDKKRHGAAMNKHKEALAENVKMAQALQAVKQTPADEQTPAAGSPGGLTANGGMY